MKAFRASFHYLSCAVLLCFFCMAPEARCADDSPPLPQQQGQSMSPAALFAAMLVDAEKGNIGAMLNLGLLYEQGIGTYKNFSKTLEWNEKAAAAGSSEGYFRLGSCHEIGVGTPSDLKKAIANYEKAVSLGSDRAMHKLASLYFTGRGIDKDETKGFELLSKASDSGNATASSELAYIYLNGLFNQKKDTAKAKALFTKSAEGGNLEAIKNLAVMFKDGIGQKADPAEALRWYLIAQKGGLQAPDLPSVIADIKKQLKPSAVKNIEAEADKWIADLKKKQQTSTQ